MLNLNQPLDSPDAVLGEAPVLAGHLLRVLGPQLAALDALQQFAVRKTFQFDLRLRISVGLTVDVQFGV